MCGHESDNVKEIIRAAVSDRERMVGIGLRARTLFDRKYSRTAATARWAELLRDVALGNAQAQE